MVFLDEMNQIFPGRYPAGELMDFARDPFDLQKLSGVFEIFFGVADFFDRFFATPAIEVITNTSALRRFAYARATAKADLAASDPLYPTRNFMV